MSGLRSGPLEAQNLDDPELFPPGFHTIKGFLSAYKNPFLEISPVFPFALPPNSASSALQNFLTMDSALDHSVRRELKALQGIKIFPHSFPNQDFAPISPGFISSESHDGQLDLESSEPMEATQRMTISPSASTRQTYLPTTIA